MQKSYWVIVLGVCGVVGAEIVKIGAWREVLTPGFVGALLIQLAGLGATIGGALYTEKPGNGKNTVSASTLAKLP